MQIKCKLIKCQGFRKTRSWLKKASLVFLWAFFGSCSANSLILIMRRRADEDAQRERQIGMTKELLTHELLLVVVESSFSSAQ